MMFSSLAIQKFTVNSDRCLK